MDTQDWAICWKSVLNEINKEGTFTQGFKDCGKGKRKVSRNLDDLLRENQKESISKFRLPSKLADKINCLSQLREKAWLLYEFPVSLNPGDKPNDAQVWKNYSSLYPVSTED